MLVMPALFNVFMMIAIGFKASFCEELFWNAASNAEIVLDAVDEDELLALVELSELLTEEVAALPEVLSDEPKSP